MGSISVGISYQLGDYIPNKPLRNIFVTYVHGYVMSFFPLVLNKPITISEYPSSLRSPHAAALKQLTSLVIKTLSPLEIKRRIKESVQLYFI
jgi:hypothetical protein